MPLVETLAWASSSYLYTYAAPSTLATAQAAAAAEASMMTAGLGAAFCYTSPLLALFGIGVTNEVIQSNIRQKNEEEEENQERQMRENQLDNA